MRKSNLVIGSSGFIGKYFCNFLEKKGELVTRFDIKNSPTQDARHKSFNFSEYSNIYFLAWDVGGAKYLYQKESQLHQLNWNLNLLTNLMPQLLQQKSNFLFISSQLAEECDTVYGVTKRLGEVWSNLINGSIARQWNAYGIVEPYNIRSHVISDFIHQAVNTGVIKMLTNGEEKRQFIHMEDISEAWLFITSNNLKGVYDITTYEWVKIIDIASYIANKTNAKVITGNKIGSSPITQIKNKIPGWKAKINLYEGILKMILNYKNKKI